MHENPLDKIQSYYDTFTKTDREIAIYLINHAHDAISGLSSEEIAKNTHSSKAALSRFCKKVGYAGFIDFRFDLARSLVSSNDDSAVNSEANPIVSISNVYSNYVLELQKLLYLKDLKKVAKEIVNARKLKIIGRNRSYNSALQFKERLNRLGIDSEAVNGDCVIEDIASIMTKDDVVVIFTTTDNTKTYNQIVNYFKASKCKIIIFTMNPNLPFKKLADDYIVLPRISKNTSMSFIDDQPIFMVFNEIILNLIAKESN